MQPSLVKNLFHRSVLGALTQVITALAGGNMTNWRDKTKMSWLFQLCLLGVSFTIKERQNV